jgi:hypothetical protein
LRRPKSASAPAISMKDISDFVRGYIKDHQTDASGDGCRDAWKAAGHGASYRRELDAEYKKQARPKGLLRNRGQRGQIAQN